MFVGPTTPEDQSHTQDEDFINKPIFIVVVVVGGGAVAAVLVVIIIIAMCCWHTKTTSNGRKNQSGKYIRYTYVCYGLCFHCMPFECTYIYVRIYIYRTEENFGG